MKPLNDQTRAVLRAAELSGSASVRTIARQVALREATVRYSLDKLSREGLLPTPQPFVNMYRLGYVEYQLFFSLGSGDQSMKKRFVTALAAAPQTAWLVELGGPYQYMALLYLRDIKELFKLLDELAHQCGNIITDKSLAVRKSYTLFGRKYLAPRVHAPAVLRYSVDDQPAAVDVKDFAILNAMLDPRFMTLREVSEATGLPITTIDRHKRKLEQSRVIEGYFYRLDGQSLGMQCFRILLSLKGTSEATRKKLRAFALKHPLIINLVECIGNWDAIIGVEVDDVRQLAELSAEIYETFGESINALHPHLFYSVLKANRYLLRTGDGVVDVRPRPERRNGALRVNDRVGPELYTVD